MKKYIVIDRDNGCRPLLRLDGTITTVEAWSDEEALISANQGIALRSVLAGFGRFEVMPEDYLRKCLGGAA